MRLEIQEKENNGMQQKYEATDGEGRKRKRRRKNIRRL